MINDALALSPATVNNDSLYHANPPTSSSSGARSPWERRTHRLRQIDVHLASLPGEWLDEADERERQRLHCWVATQQAFIADLGETLRLRGLHATETLGRDEALLLQEVDRFIDQTEKALGDGRTAQKH